MSAEIAAICEAVADAAVEAQAWLDHPANSELVGAEKKPVRRQLRRGGLRARKLAQAAARPMCISVFGPSQAGKSFLVSVLARPCGGRLLSSFPDPQGRLDFISQINPEGEGESTGLVTRFTIRTYTAPPGFPVKLRLLTESDVARILANTFLMDGDKSEPEPTAEEIDGLVARFRSRMAAAAAPGLSPDDVIEIQDYVQKGFGRSAYVAQLASFWDDAVELAPRLSIPDRAALLSLIWGRHASFTRLYERLARALEALGNPSEAFAGLDALTPREDSIIDVKLLNGLDEDGERRKSGPPLALTTAEGRRAELAKPVVAAITAEIVMPMADKPHELFEGTDLLDFPGARTRFEKPLEKFLGEAAEPLKECVLRGKVAYLFDRYVAEQEITSMLLCIPDSNMEVADLPGLIADWIAHTHGGTPEQRAAADKLLFFVLTKFDKHLIDSAAASDDARTRFQRRIQASLLEKFAPMAESWPSNWTGGQPFDNCFWLRNPNFPAESVIEYEGGIEVAYIERKSARLAELREGCVGAELVQRHFQDPAAAWDAAMALNDGGVSYLMRHLEPVCRPEMKVRQITAQCRETAQRLSRLVSRFHVSDDLARRLDERRAAAQALMGELLRVFEHRLFGALLNELTVLPEQIAERMQRPPATVRLVASRPPAVAAGPAGGIVLPGGAAALAAVRPPPAKPAVRPEAERIRTLSRAEWRAEVAFGMWVEHLKAFAAAEDLEQRLAMGAEAASELSGELIAGARRLGVERRIADDLERRAYLERGDAGVSSAALIAAETLNAFSTEAAATLIPLDQRPDIPVEAGGRKPFSPRPQTDGVEKLPATPRRADADYLTSWMHMVYRLFEDNAKDTEGGIADPEQNARLGAILNTLATP